MFGIGSFGSWKLLRTRREGTSLESFAFGSKASIRELDTVRFGELKSAFWIRRERGANALDQADLRGE
jgi:hypothetical protein